MKARVLVVMLSIAAGCRSRAAPTATSAITFVGADGGPVGDEGIAKPPEPALRQRLTPMQYDVTQQEGTEPPFDNEYWNNHEPGLYVDIVTGEPLFLSIDKFDSGTGWPSFTRPLAPEHVTEHRDVSFGGIRTEVRSTAGHSHLGHVFGDGPKPTGLRYCINSAALHFIPVAQLEAQGYGRFKARFATTP